MHALTKHVLLYCSQTETNLCDGLILRQMVIFSINTNTKQADNPFWKDTMHRAWQILTIH